jgi:hypothetical protein
MIWPSRQVRPPTTPPSSGDADTPPAARSAARISEERMAALLE